MKDDKYISNLFNNTNIDHLDGKDSAWRIHRKLKRNTKFICDELKNPTTEFKYNSFIRFVQHCLEENEKEVILYSSISSVIFNANDIERDNMITNMENAVGETLLKYHDRNIVNFVIRINEHIQLSYQQVNFAKKFYRENLKEAKDEVKAENKGMEKEYVTILGIFAAIVLAFTGGLKFSTSVINSICNVGLYKLSIITLVVGLILVAIFFGLYWYIDTIIKDREENDKRKRNFIIATYAAIIIVMAMILLAA